MTSFVRKLLHRAATVAALVFGALLAALFAALALAAALAIGAALWLANRFGMRAMRPDRRPGAPRETDVIDVEMREVESDAQGVAPNTDAGQETSARPRPQSDEGPRGP
ncbi:MAG TPA: hypothetical protein VK052_17495 [Zeimonas sp.]|nr:hypothetical protein [Zeimonas sp.]